MSVKLCRVYVLTGIRVRDTRIPVSTQHSQSPPSCKGSLGGQDASAMDAGGEAETNRMSQISAVLLVIQNLLQGGGVRHFENSPSSARVINARVRDWKLFKRFPPSSYHCMMMTFMSTNWSSSGHPSNHPIYTGQYRNGWKSYLPENAILAGTRLQKQLPTSQPMNPQECCSGWRTQSLQGHDFKDRT